MAQWFFLNTLTFQILMCLIFISETSKYEKIKLESGKLCRLRDGEDLAEVKLEKNELSSKVVIQSKYFDRWSGKYSFSCSFYVRAPSRFGIYAVIQNLNFRRKAGSKDCLDFVEFEIPQHPLKSFFSKANPRRYCGKLSANSIYASDIKEEVEYSDALTYSYIGPNGFVSKENILLVKIYIAKEKLESDEKLDIELVFTSFKQDCKERENSFQCKECEWIWEGFFLDKLQNCPYASCLDENFCKNVDAKNEVRNIVSSETGTKISIGAIATIILVLLMFSCCVWMVRRMQICCFDPSNTRQSRMEMNSTQRTSRTDENITPYGDMLPETTAPSAPPISEDKDLPPSYSSLFPGK